MFASKNVTAHLLRGAAGFSALASALVLHDAWSWPLVGLALVALRGCPTCWTIGLLQTVAPKLAGGRSRSCRRRD